MSLPLEGGVYDGTDLADKVFYGFLLNNNTGDLNIQIVDDGTVVISEGDDQIINPDDYKAVMWTRDTLNFEFNVSNGHLHLIYK